MAKNPGPKPRNLTREARAKRAKATRVREVREQPRAVREQRVAPAFYVLRQFAIMAAAAADVSTVDIAKALDVDRSFVIRQTTITLKPRTPAERRILKLAEAHGAALKRRGLGTLLTGGEDIEITLAGGERQKLGPLAERRAAKAAAAKAPKAKAPAKPKPTPPPKPSLAAEKPKASKPKAAVNNAGAALAKRREEKAAKAAAKAAKPKSQAEAPAAPDLFTPENETPVEPAATLADLGLDDSPDPAQPL
jgi:hypothetical protein